MSHCELETPQTPVKFKKRITLFCHLCFLTDSVSLSCLWSATTRQNTARMFPLWGSTGNPGWHGGTWRLLAANADDEMRLFTARFGVGTVTGVLSTSCIDRKAKKIIWTAPATVADELHLSLWVIISLFSNQILMSSWNTSPEMSTLSYN